MADKLYAKHLKELLWHVPNFSPREQEYIKAVFGKYSHFNSTGITRAEAEKALHDLKQNQRDEIDNQELAALEEAIQKYFDN